MTTQLTRTDILQYGQRALDVLHHRHGVIYAVFSNTVYLEGGDSLCCLGLESLVNGPINIRSGFNSLPKLSVGDSWSYRNNTLALGQFCCCNTRQATLWTAPVRPVLSASPVYTRCIQAIENALGQECGTGNNAQDKTATDTLIEKRLEHYQSLLVDSLKSPGTAEPYTVPAELIGLLGCGDGLTPAGDDILLGVLVAAIHFNQPHLSEPITKWMKQYAASRTSQISYAHLLGACEGQAIEHLHTLLHTISREINNPAKNYGLNLALQGAIKELINHGQSSGFYTMAGVLVILNYLANSTLEQH